MAQKKKQIYQDYNKKQENGPQQQITPYQAKYLLLFVPIVPQEH